MNTKIQPGYGYRLLANGELKTHDSEFLRLGGEEWAKTCNVGRLVDASDAVVYRQKIDPGQGFHIVPMEELQIHGSKVGDQGFYVSGWMSPYDCDLPAEEWTLPSVNAVRRRTGLPATPAVNSAVGSFIIVRNGKVAPDPFVHTNIDDAKHEARRLASLSPGTVLIYRAVYEIKSEVATKEKEL